MSEDRVAAIWEELALKGLEMASEDGRRLDIIYPGRRNDRRGGDYRDAVVAVDGKPVFGDIEVHVASSGWTGHGHHLDPAYNSVVLHVVMRPDAAVRTRLQNGEEVPVVSLEKYFRGDGATQRAGEAALSLPCLGLARRSGNDWLIRRLEAAGERRFRDRAGAFSREIGEHGAGQALFRGLMDALGYSRNREPFLELAGRLPLAELAGGESRRKSEERYLLETRARLLGAAGFLQPCGDKLLLASGVSPESREALAGIFRDGCHRPAMQLENWSFFKVRPQNSPVRRLLAAAGVLARFRRPGLLPGLLELVERSPDKNPHLYIEGGLIIGGPPALVSGGALIGRPRARDIALNIMLPFALAWSEVESLPGYGRRALAVYRGYPGATENSVERHMKNQLGLGLGVALTARRQQGLLQIYKTMCALGRCGACPLGQLEPRDDIQVQSGSAAGPEAVVAAGGNHSGVVRA